MKFVRKDYPTIMSGLVIRYKLDSDQWDAEINASRDGVSLRGIWPVVPPEQAVVIEETLARARIHALELARQYGIMHPIRVCPLTEEEVDRLLGSLPSYEG